MVVAGGPATGASPATLEASRDGLDVCGRDGAYEQVTHPGALEAEQRPQRGWQLRRGRAVDFDLRQLFGCLERLLTGLGLAFEDGDPAHAMAVHRDLRPSVRSGRAAR